jgi:hypothetical protein
VRTIVGHLSPIEEWAIAELPHGGELHVDSHAAGRIWDRLARRVTAVHQLKPAAFHCMRITKSVVKEKIFIDPSDKDLLHDVIAIEDD